MQKYMEAMKKLKLATLGKPFETWLELLIKTGKEEKWMMRRSTNFGILFPRILKKAMFWQLHRLQMKKAWLSSKKTTESFKDIAILCLISNRLLGAMEFLIKLFSWEILGAVKNGLEIGVTKAQNGLPK